MKLDMTLGGLAEAAGGKLLKGGPGAPFDSFVTDTRRLKPGEFLWALKGASFDAHDFLAHTLPAGPSGWLAREGVLAGMKDLPPAAVGVADTLKALQDLAAAHRRRFSIPVTAITGSNGKSTTKEMLKSIYSAAGSTCSNAGNFNNQFGLPLSLLELLPQHRYGVFELGASKRGDITEIGRLARPTCGIITNIGPSHLAYFGDLETVYETKTELAWCLADGGTLVYNSDDRYLERLNARKDLKKLTFGRSESADLRILEDARLRIEHRGEIHTIALPHACGHNFYNAAAAAAAALVSGLDFQAIKTGLESFQPPPMRMQEFRVGGALVILDAYNSNPQSAGSALKHVFGLPKPLYVMMGDMKELGAHSAHYHRDLGAALAHTGAEKIFLAGPEMKPALEACLAAGAKAVIYGENLDAWLQEARGLIKTGKGTFLIKASRSMKFERITEGLQP